MTAVEQIEPAQQLVRVDPRRPDIAPAQQRAHNDVILEAQRRKRAHQLERAGDAAAAHRVGRKTGNILAGKIDRAGIGRYRAGDHVEQRRLAGAVRTNHRKDRALGY